MARRYCYLSGRLQQLGYRQSDLTRPLHLSGTAISRRFNGLTPWTLDEMYAVLDICRATPEELHIYFPPKKLGVLGGKS